MKKLTKIKFIEKPKKSFLSKDEQSTILGGSSIQPLWTCTSFSECGLFRRDSCGSWDSGSCGGGNDHCYRYQS